MYENKFRDILLYNKMKIKLTLFITLQKYTLNLNTIKIVTKKAYLY